MNLQLFRTYYEENGRAVATLIDNSDLKQIKARSNEAYRMIMSINDETGPIDIIPVIKSDEERQLKHVISKRNSYIREQEPMSIIADQVIAPDGLFREEGSMELSGDKLM